MSSRQTDPAEEPNDPVMRECAFVRENLAGFVLDALDSFERGIVEHHLRWCDECRSEADTLEHVVHLLPFSVPNVEAPAPALKASVLGRIANLDTAEPILHTAPPVPVQPAPSNPPSWYRYVSTVLVAPLALALVVMGVWANSLHDDLGERDSEYESQVQLNQALANGGQVQLYSVEQSCPTCRGNGQLGVSESNGMGMVVGWDFDPNKQHDVWGVNTSGERKKVCQLHVDASGAVMQMFSFPEATTLITDIYITDENGVTTYESHLTINAGDDETVITPVA